MINEIQAKVLLSHVKQPDSWFGLKYNMNLYRGCQHQCIYCDSRSECYAIQRFSDVQIKVNAIDLLRQELPRKRVKGLIGTGSMSDPYTYVERHYNLTGRALQVIAQHRFPVHIITKSDMVLRDLDILQEITRVRAYVSFTITTANDELAKRLEPFAPSPTQRLTAIQTLAAAGIPTGVTMMPILPFIEDDPSDITEIIEKAHNAGASYIIPWFGMTLRDRQRDYFYDKLDNSFPGTRQQYERAFGNRYDCPTTNAEQLYELFHQQCEQRGLATRVEPFQSANSQQLSLF